MNENHQMNRMGEKCWLLLTSWILTSAAFAAPSGQLDFKLLGKSVQESVREVSVAGAGVRLGGQAPLTSFLEANGDVELRLETGSSRESYSQSYGPQKGFRLNEAALRLHAKFGNLAGQFKLGAIDQGLWNQPLALTRQSFPAVVERLRWSLGQWRLEGTAEQAVANAVLSSPFRTDLQGEIPTFLFERLTVSRGFGLIHMELRTSHYLFQNLNESTAIESQFLGSSVLGLGRSNRQFAQGFQGWEGQLHLRADIHPDISWGLRVGGLRNSEVQGVSASGWYGLSEFHLSLGKWGELTPQLLLFEMGSQTVPGVYGNSELGFVNRRGWSVALQATAQQWGPLHFDAKYVSASPQTASIYQGDFRFFQLGVSQRYEF